MEFHYRGFFDVEQDVLRKLHGDLVEEKKKQVQTEQCCRLNAAYFKGQETPLSTFFPPSKGRRCFFLVVDYPLAHTEDKELGNSGALRKNSHLPLYCSLVFLKPILFLVGKTAIILTNNHYCFGRMVLGSEILTQSRGYLFIAFHILRVLRNIIQCLRANNNKTIYI